LVVVVPAFLGCFSASFDVQDLLRLVQEAVEVWCDGED
jgi:predicted RNase H-like HicB family nuclease